MTWILELTETEAAKAEESMFWENSENTHDMMKMGGTEMRTQLREHCMEKHNQAEWGCGCGNATMRQ